MASPNTTQQSAADESTPLLSTTTEHSNSDSCGCSRSGSGSNSSDVAQQHEPESSMASSLFWRVGALYGASAVALGAFGAHGLKNHVGDDPKKLANWSTAAQYQLVHSVVILLAAGNGSPLAATLLTTGVTMFSGSLYALVLDPERFKVLGPVTPLGGLCMIGGWLILGFASRGRVFRR